MLLSKSEKETYDDFLQKVESITSSLITKGPSGIAAF